MLTMILTLAVACADMTAYKAPGISLITKAEKISDNLPARCRIDGVLDQRTGAGAIVDWVEKGKARDSVVAKSRTAPARSRPLCAYPAHAQYNGTGDPQDAASFSCRE